MRRILLLTCLLAVFQPIGAQDTLRFMTYNILNYTSTNSYASRYNDLKLIIAHVQPDIVVCQEVKDASGAQLLLDNAFNPGGGSTYARATFIDGPDTDNSLFYNTTKIKFKSQHQITTDVRDITHYRIYHLLGATDTAWINVFSQHLKASTGGGEESQRLAECQTLCTYLGTLAPTENIIVAGDCNFYGNSTETGFNWLISTNCARQLYDPINRIGDWNNNSTFKDIHTQSTRVNNEPDGGSTGGLDDRFDFIFVNDRVKNGLSKVRCIPSTYTAVGNDAQHLNKAINAIPTNTAVPAAIADALYYMSDHLPVYMDLAMGDAVGISEYHTLMNGTNVKWIFRENNLMEWFVVNSKENQQLNARVYDLNGKEIFSQTIQVSVGANDFMLDLTAVSRGQYLLRLEGKEGWTGCKFIKF